MSKELKNTLRDKKLSARNEMTDSQYAACHGIIHTTALASGAVGAIPIPIADAIPISAAQVGMVISLGSVFGKHITTSAAIGLLSGAAASHIGRNAVKLIPVVGWIASAVVAATITEIVGWSIAIGFTAKSSEDFYQEGFVDASDVYKDKLTSQAELFAQQQAHWRNQEAEWALTDKEKGDLICKCMMYIRQLEQERDDLQKQNQTLSREKQRLLDELHDILGELKNMRAA